VDKTAARASELGDVLPQLNKRTDCIEIDQLPAWFAGTDKLRSRVAAAYLQCLVLTGARREEMAALRWADVDFQWSKLTIADKVDNTRTIPLSPYVASLLAGLPRTGKLKNGEANPFVFASTLSASGRIMEPRAPLEEVLAHAGIPHMTIHGLRRTFSLLGEAAGAPAGAIAQVMGHKPSATAEGYRPRSIDALRPYLALIEAFILDTAGIAFDPAAAGAGGLKLIASA
jgi:integrase